MGLDVAIYDGDDRKLAHMRIGNIAQVAFLRDLAKDSLGADSIVVSKVLYDGTHSGDSIGISHLESLSKELTILSGMSEPEVQKFARDMLEIVCAAREYGMTIQFS
jgi:hypothetical protein